MIQVKIIKSLKISYWYTKHIGKVMSVYDGGNDSWYIITDWGTRYLIDKDDTILFNRKEKLEKIISKI